MIYNFGTFKQIVKMIIFQTNADMDEDFMVRDFVPCDNYLDSGYEFYGYCQAGASMALDDDNLLIGM